ncbi:hypothetical protein MTR_2g023380 [Medicago truncatula]|uniref:Uncharacterized protein n=1 Tax=Medicago truncatula TaxID=3880 RepID=A0A072VFG7_MEDTR|nr:hypothetical protein MTR_2g023380 [Medicago truncatula]
MATSNENGFYSLKMSFYYSRVEDKVLDLAMYLQANSFLPPLQINIAAFSKDKES